MAPEVKCLGKKKYLLERSESMMMENKNCKISLLTLLKLGKALHVVTHVLSLLLLSFLLCFVLRTKNVCGWYTSFDHVDQEFPQVDSIT